MVTKLSKAIKFGDTTKVFTALFYIELVIIRGMNFSTNDINVLSLFVREPSKKAVIDKAIELNYVKSFQSGDNAVSRLVKHKVLNKEKGGIRKISKEYLNMPHLDELIMVNLILHNVNS